MGEIWEKYPKSYPKTTFRQRKHTKLPTNNLLTDGRNTQNRYAENVYEQFHIFVWATMCLFYTKSKIELSKQSSRRILFIHI